MFTGLVEELGKVVAVARGGEVRALTIDAPRSVAALAVGDSIAVSGVCLTATAIERESFSVELVQETLARTTLGALREGSSVNLELSMPATGRFGGHIVQGHVDGTAPVLSLRRTGGEARMTLGLDEGLARYVVEKGSIAVDGVSLTVAERDPASFTVVLIPFTLAQTTLGSVQGGDRVNLEVDIVAKYVAGLLGRRT